MRWRLMIMPIVVVAIGALVSHYSNQANNQASVRKSDEPNPRPVDPSAESQTDSKVSVDKIDQPKPETLEKIMETDPVRFLKMALEKYDNEIQGYSLIFDKHERVNGTLRKPEKTEVHFREKPFSVHMSWLEGAGLATKVLYVEGENNNKMLARPWGPLRLLGIQTRDVDGADAKAAGRFTIAQFGFKRSSNRSLASMEKAKERGTLHVKYEGVVPVDKLDGQKCHKFVREPYDPLEEDDLNRLVLYFDTEHWLQVGSTLHDVKGQLLGEYFFSKIRINPTFGEKQFTKDGL